MGLKISIYNKTFQNLAFTEFLMNCKRYSISILFDRLQNFASFGAKHINVIAKISMLYTLKGLSEIYGFSRISHVLLDIIKISLLLMSNDRFQNFASFGTKYINVGAKINKL